MRTSSEKPDTKEENVGAKKVRRARYVNLETEKRITWGAGDFSSEAVSMERPCAT